MTESQWTGKLLKELRRRMPNAVIIKFNDRSTSGIPDFCIVRDGVTQWFEVKVNNRDPYEPLQWTMLYRMKGSYIIALKGKCFIVRVEAPYGLQVNVDICHLSFNALVDELVTGGK